MENLHSNTPRSRDTHLPTSLRCPIRLREEVTAGHAAGSWLVERVQRGHLAARDGWDGDAVYNFDLAMMSNGLLTFGGRFDSADFVEAGLILANRLAEQVQATGRLSALPSGQSTARSVWSTHGSALMVKATQCLLSAHEVDPSGRFESSARAVVAMAPSLQQDDGRIVTHPRDTETMCHPHLYAVEGLWVYGSARGDRDALERARAEQTGFGGSNSTPVACLVSSTPHMEHVVPSSSMSLRKRSGQQF